MSTGKTQINRANRPGMFGSGDADEQRLTFYFGNRFAEATLPWPEADNILTMLKDRPNDPGLLTINLDDGLIVHVPWRSIDSIEVRPA